MTTNPFSEHQPSSKNTTTAWTSCNYSDYIELTDKGDTNVRSPSSNVKSLTPASPVEEDVEGCEEFPLWIATAEENKSGRPLKQLTSDDTGTESKSPRQRNRPEPSTSHASLSTRSCTAAGSSCDIVPAGTSSSAGETLCAGSKAYRELSKEDIDENEGYTQRSKVLSAETTTEEPRVHKKGKASSCEKSWPPSTPGVNDRLLTSVSTYAHDTRIYPFYYGAWRASTDVPATASLQWGSDARFTDEAITADSFSNVLHCPALPASPSRIRDDSSEEAADDVYLHAIDRLSPSASTCEGHTIDRHSPAVQEARPLSSNSGENLNTAHIHAHDRSPGCFKSLPFVERGVSPLGIDSCSILYQDGTGPYFCPVQQSSPTLSTRPPQPRLLQSLKLYPLTSDRSLPFLLPHVSPSCAIAPDGLTTGRDSPASPRTLSSISLPACSTAAARKGHTRCDANSPSSVSLPGTSPSSRRYNETTWERSSSSEIAGYCLREPKTSTAGFHQDGTESADLAKTEAPRRQLDPPASSIPARFSEELSPNEVHDAAATTPQPSSVYRRQPIKPMEEIGATISEESIQEQIAGDPFSQALHGFPPHNGHKSAALFEAESPLHETVKSSSPQDPRANKADSPRTAEDSCLTGRHDVVTEASNLVKEACVSNKTLKGNEHAHDKSFFVKDAFELPASERPPFFEGSIALSAKNSFPLLDAPASLPIKNESPPPLLLGRNSLPLPSCERKPLPYGCVTVSEHFEQKPGQPPDLILPEPSTQELATPRTEATKTLLDPQKTMQAEACSELPQHAAPFTSSLAAIDELHQPAGIFGAPFPFPFSHQIPQPYQYACPGNVDTPGSLPNDSYNACADPLSQQASQPNVLQQLPVGHAVDSNALPVMGPPTLLGSFPFSFPNVFWGGNRHLTEPAADQIGQQLYDYPNVLAYPLVASQYSSNLQEPDATAFAVYNCGVPLPPPWLSDQLCHHGTPSSQDTPPENATGGQGEAAILADNLPPHMPHQESLSPGRLSNTGSCIPRVVAVPPLFRDASTDLSLDTHTRPAPALDAVGFRTLLPGGLRATVPSFVVSGEVYRRTGPTASRNSTSDPARCALRIAKTSRKRRLLQKCTPPEFAARDHKDYLLELLACNLEPVKGVHMDRLRKTWVASWLVGKRRVTRIFSFQKFGFFGAREQAIRQRREALLNPELESEEAQRVVAAAAGAAAAAAVKTTRTIGTGAPDAGGEEESSLSPDRRLVQKIADSLPFVVGVTYHGESFSWIANHRKPMGKIVARRRFSIAEYGFLEARRRAAVMMFHWHKQGRVVEPEDYDQGAAAIFNAQQRPQLPDANNGEGFVYWYPACTANEPLYLLTAFDEESCDDAMVLLASICGNPWKKVCKGQPQAGVDEVLPAGCEAAATARFLSSFHSEGACTNWYLSNSQKREKNTSFWEALKKGRLHLDAKKSCSLSPRKRLKSNTAAKKNPYARKYASSDAQEKMEASRSFLVSPRSGAHEALRKRQDQAPCKSKIALRRADDDEEKAVSAWETKAASPHQKEPCAVATPVVFCTKKDESLSRKTHLLLKSRTLDKCGDVTEDVPSLQCSARSNSHSSAVEGKSTMASSTYWTRRKQAEQSKRRKEESDNDGLEYAAEKADALRSSEGASHAAESLVQDSDAQEQPHSAHDVLRACFGSEPALRIRSATASREEREPETLMSNCPSVEADETGTDVEDEEIEEAEEVEEEEEEPVSISLRKINSRSISANEYEVTNRKDRRLLPADLGCSAQALQRDVTRGHPLRSSFKKGTACEEACYDVRPSGHIEHGPPFSSRAHTFTQPAHILESTSWFPDSFVENVTLLKQGPHNTCNVYCTQQSGDQCEQSAGGICLPKQLPGQFCSSRCSSFYSDLSQTKPLHSSILSAIKSEGRTFPPSATPSSSAELWNAGNKCRPTAYATIGEAGGSHTIQSEKY